MCSAKKPKAPPSTKEDVEFLRNAFLDPGSARSAARFGRSALRIGGGRNPDVDPPSAAQLNANYMIPATVQPGLQIGAFGSVRWR